MSVSAVQQRLVNVDELAIILRLSPLTIRDWRKQNPPRGPRACKLSPSRQGRILFDLGEVEKWKADPVAYERRNRSRHRGPRN
jgi:hypothetical protein